MKSIRTLVVDDEPLARARVIKLLKQLDFIELIGECKNGQEAYQKIFEYEPELIFLDVQMPDFDGFEVLNRIENTPLPFIIFITAFDQYALKAFDVHAVDYLLKPYDDDRFMNAVEHARKQISLKRKAVLHHKMLNILDDYHLDQGIDTPIIEIKDREKSIRVKKADIYYLESFGNYVKIHTDRKTLLHRQTLQSLEEEMDRRFFLRIHRSYILNSIYVLSTKYHGNNQYLFRLKNDTELYSSRTYKEDIEAFLREQEIQRKL